MGARSSPYSSPALLSSATRLEPPPSLQLSPPMNRSSTTRLLRGSTAASAFNVSSRAMSAGDGSWSLVERHMRRVGAGLELVPRSRDVHEDTPHQLDGYGEKCARIPPLHAARIHEAEVRLVDQRNGVERVAGPPAGHVAM